MSSSNEKDDTPPPEPRIGFSDNRGLLGIFGNYLLELKEHDRRFESLYDELRQMDYPAPRVWAEKVLIEFERHHDTDGENLQSLRDYVKS